jgi:hypothetical protein
MRLCQPWCMIVQCVKIISPIEGEGEVAEYPGVRVGALYSVLDIGAGPDYYWIRIWDEGREGPGSLWDPEMFETVDSRMSSRWTASIDQGHLRFAPHAWQRPGFWDDYFQGIPDAVASVKSEIEFMLAEQ